jgi:hypothetical protein
MYFRDAFATGDVCMAGNHKSSASFFGSAKV